MRLGYRVGLVPLRLVGLVVLAAVAIPAVAEALKPIGKKVGDGLKDWGDKLNNRGDCSCKPPVADPPAEASQSSVEEPVAPKKATAAKKPAAKRTVTAKRITKPKKEDTPPAE